MVIIRNWYCFKIDTNMIKDHCKHDPVDTVKDFKPIIELLNLVVRLIDIMNALKF